MVKFHLFNVSDKINNSNKIGHETVSLLIYKILKYDITWIFSKLIIIIRNSNISDRLQQIRLNHD